VLKRLFLVADLIVPEVIVTNIPGNMKHPCFKVTLAPEKVPVLQDPEEYILNKIFTQVRIFVHAVKETKQRFLIPFKKQPQLVYIAISNLEHQGIVV
jgi:hypothetical protein